MTVQNELEIVSAADSVYPFIKYKIYIAPFLVYYSEVFPIAARLKGRPTDLWLEWNVSAGILGSKGSPVDTKGRPSRRHDGCLTTPVSVKTINQAHVRSPNMRLIKLSKP